jgi:Cof subfamily protein (haloacid dehalogenase superfamily)
MRFDQAAILTDLDGTLFNSQGEVTRADRAAIRTFIAGGGLFAVATGREPHNARRHLPDVPLNGPSIVLNGAAVYDFVRRRYLSTIPMDKAAAEDVLSHCLKMDWPLDLQVYTTDGIYYASPLDVADPGFLRIHQPTTYEPMAALLEKTWIKTVLLERAADALAPMRAYLAEKGYDQRLALVEGTTDVVKIGKYQELLPQDVNKGTGVDALRQLPVYAGRTLIAVGDYWNDMELLEAADIACCPANAIPEVKAVCAHILPSHNDDPMVALIRDVIPAL